MKRVCKECFEEKNIQLFPKHIVNGVDYYSYQCKSCRNKSRRLNNRTKFIPIKGELAKAIEGYEDKYLITNFGRLVSLMHSSFHGSRKRDYPVINATPLNGSGYPSFCLLKNGKKTPYRVHILVAKYFIPNPNNLPIVMHLDDNKSNCHYLNLKWGTQQSNLADAFKKGIIKPSRGEASKKSNLKNEDVLTIFKSKRTIKELAYMYNVSVNCIRDIKNGKSWNHITGLLCTRKKRPKYSKITQFV